MKMKLGTNAFQRVRSLTLILANIDQCNNDLKRDYCEDVGIKYDVWYPDNAESHALFKKADDLYQLRKDKLFTEVLGFSQTFYSLKEYLKAFAPDKKGIVEDFFSNEKIDLLSRNQIANDLKHNPDKDLVFDARVVKKETLKEPGKMTHISYMKHSWFYENQESVEYCHRLYNELLVFLNQNFSSHTDWE